MKRLLRLYPRAWRDRYLAEMEAVLDGMPFDPRAALDLVACAADAHLHPPGGRRPLRLPLIAQLALLVVMATLAVPFLVRLVEPLLLRSPNGYLADPVLPAAVPALAALSLWRAGWRLATWFCCLLAVDLVVANGGWLWDFLYLSQRVLEPLRLATSGWHPAWFRLGWPYAAAVVVGSGAVAALLLRRLDVRWPVGLGIGLLLVGSTGVWTLWAYIRPNFVVWAGHPGWFRLEWLVDPAQALAWGALAAALLRRVGLVPWAGLLTGILLWTLIGSTWFLPGYPVPLFQGPIPVWPLPGAAWAAVIAALVCARAVEPAQREPAQPEAAPA